MSKRKLTGRSLPVPLFLYENLHLVSARWPSNLIRERLFSLRPAGLDRGKGWEELDTTPSPVANGKG
jgi:hypothetical protein